MKLACLGYDWHIADNHFLFAETDRNAINSHPRLSSNNLHMSVHRINTLVNYFDTDGQGHMNIEAFIQGMRGNLNKRRLRAVKMAFSKADVRGDGKLHVDDLVKCLNVEMMPEVRKGTMTTEEATKAFISRLEGTTTMIHSEISFEEFVDYYSWLSCSIMDDSTFVEMIDTAWGVSEQDTAEDRLALCSEVLIRHADGKVKGVSDKIKQQHYMKTTLQHFDLENKGSLTMDQFLKATHRMSCTMNEDIGQLFFNKFSNSEGLLDYIAMSEALFR